jgi:hypothetical protein
MVRHGTAVAAALIVLIALPSAPRAATDAGQLVGSQSGKILCLVSADNVSLGGGPIVACQQFDETSTRFTYDATGHGMSVSPAYIRSF